MAPELRVRSEGKYKAKKSCTNSDVVNKTSWTKLNKYYEYFVFYISWLIKQAEPFFFHIDDKLQILYIINSPMLVSIIFYPFWHIQKINKPVCVFFLFFYFFFIIMIFFKTKYSDISYISDATSFLIFDS